MEIIKKNNLILPLSFIATLGFYIFQTYVLFTTEPDALGSPLFIWFYCYPINILLTQSSLLLWLFKKQNFSYLQIFGAALIMSIGYILTFALHLMLFSLFPQPLFELIPENLKIFIPTITLILLNCPLDYAIARLFFKQNVPSKLICLATITALIVPILFLIIRLYSQPL